MSINSEIINSDAFSECIGILQNLRIEFDPNKRFVLLDGIMHTTHNCFANILFGLVLHEQYGYNLAFITPLNSDHFVCQLYGAIGAIKYNLFMVTTMRISRRCVQLYVCGI